MWNGYEIPDHWQRWLLRAPPPAICCIDADGSLYPDSCRARRVLVTAESGHVWTGPGWQGFSSRVQPFQPSHHAGCPTRSLSRRECDGFLVALAPGHHCTSHSGHLVGKRDGSNLGGPPRQQRCKPRPMLGIVELRIADHTERTGCEQAARITIALFADAAELVFAPLEFCFGTSPIQAEKSRPDRNALGSATLATRAVASAGPTPGIASSLLLVSFD